MRLKLDSLVTERQFLMNENKTLKSRVDLLVSKLDVLNVQHKEAKSQIKELTVLRAEQIERIAALDQRYARAKKVAAHMEKQIKEAKPNTKIDYQMIDNPEPSTQLLAAILAKVRKYD